MKKLFARSFLILFLGISVTLADNFNKDSGSISGRISPKDVSVKIIAKIAGTEYMVKGNVKGEVNLNQGGKFIIKDLPAGRYDLLFFLQNSSQEKYVATRWSEIIVQRGQNVEGINYRLTPVESEYLIDEVLVGFGKDIEAKDARETINSLGCMIKDESLELGETTFYTVDIPDDKTVDEIIQEFKKKKGVVSAEPNGITHVDKK